MRLATALENGDASYWQLLDDALRFEGDVCLQLYLPCAHTSVSILMCVLLLLLLLLLLLFFFSLLLSPFSLSTDVLLPAEKYILTGQFNGIYISSCLIFFNVQNMC